MFKLYKQTGSGPIHRVMSGLTVLMLIVWLAGVHTSCEKQYSPLADTLKAYPYIMDHIEDQPQYSLLKLALTRSEVNLLLRDRGNCTFFAPDNTAFLSAGFDSTTIIQTDKQRLRYMMKYLILPGILRGDTVRSFTYRTNYPSYELTNLDSIPVNLAYGGGKLTIYGGYPFDIADSLHANNGRIFPIGFFPKVPTGSIYQQLKEMGNATLFLTAIHHSDYMSLFTSYLDTLGVMVPTDSAFSASGFTDTLAIINLGKTKIDALVTSHTIGSRLYSNPVNGQPLLPTVSFSRWWIISGLVHNGHQYLRRSRDPQYSTCYDYYPDTYSRTLLAQRSFNVSCPYSYMADLGFVSDGAHYAFYRQTFTSDSAVVARVIRPNIVAINGLIHLIDHVLPMD